MSSRENIQGSIFKGNMFSYFKSIISGQVIFYGDDLLFFFTSVAATFLVYVKYGMLELEYNEICHC